MLLFYCLLHCGCWDILTVDCGSMLLILPLVNSWLGVAGQGFSWFLVTFFVRGRGRQGSVNHFFLLWVRASCGHAGLVFAPLRLLSGWISCFCHGLFSGVSHLPSLFQSAYRGCASLGVGLRKTIGFSSGLAGLLSDVRVVLQGMMYSYYCALNARCNCLRLLSFRDFKRTNYYSVGLDVDLLIWVRGVRFVEF
jgi:hypothetical protein